MKKIAALFLSIALCMGLAVPAFAANYEPYTVTTEGATLTFDATSVTKETIKLQGMEGDPYEKEVTMVTLKPGSSVTVKTDGGGDSFFTYTSYEKDADSDIYGMGMTEYGFRTGSVDISFQGWDGVTRYDLILGVGDDICVRLSADTEQSSKPAAPATPTEPTTPADKPTQTTTPVTPATGSYTVKQGDTYGTIALNNYGTYGAWKELYNANKGAKLVPGVQLTLPEKLGKTARIAAPVAGAGESLYTVKAGDTLGAIAKATYGDVTKYQAIFERNSDRLKNANTIYAGQVIVLPAK